jgi:DNA polymerase-3 subunit delta
VLVHWSLADDIRLLCRLQTALQGGRPMAMAMREQRVWGAKEKLVERLADRLRDAPLAELLQGAHVCDGIVKGLRDPAWPDDPWQALRQLALLTIQVLQPPARARRDGAPVPVRLPLVLRA